jgi:hypothetical protein
VVRQTPAPPYRGMEGARCVSFVTGPLQAMAAIEALLNFGATGPVLYYSERPPLPGIYDLFHRADVAPLRWINRSERMRKIPHLLRAVSRAALARRVIIGSVNQRPFLLAAAFARDEVVLVDDGALTEAVVARRTSGLKSKTVLGRRLDARPLLIFSIYSPETRTRDVVVRNQLAHIRGLYSGPVRCVDEAWIVGQPLDRWMTFAHYKELIRRFIERVGTERMVYVSHPRESDAAGIKLSAELGLEMRRLDTPLELELLSRREAPRRIFSISSTVLDTLPLLLPGGGSSPELWTVDVDVAELRSVPEDVVRRFSNLRVREDLLFV